MLMIIFILVLVAPKGVCEEYWTGTSDNDRPAAIDSNTVYGYYVVWNSGGRIYVTNIDTTGYMSNNTEIKVVGANVTASDAVLNNTKLYILAGDNDNNTVVYLIKYDVVNKNVDYVCKYVVSNPVGPVASEPRTVVYDTSYVYLLLSHQDKFTILVIKPNTGSVVMKRGLMITNSSYIDMDVEEGYLYILGHTYLNGVYRMLLVRTDLSGFNTTETHVLVGEQGVFIRGKSLFVEKGAVYVLAGVGGAGAPGLHVYTGLFKYKAAILSLIDYRIYKTTGYYFGYGDFNPNKITPGSNSFYITGYLANSTDAGKQDIFIAGFDYTSLNNTWAKKWDGFTGVERGVAVKCMNNLVVATGFSPKHTGVFSNVTLEAYTGATAYTASLYGESSTYNVLEYSVSASVSTKARVAGLDDIVVLSVNETGQPEPIPEFSSYYIVMVIAIILILLTIYYVFRRNL